MRKFFLLILLFTLFSFSVGAETLDFSSSSYIFDRTNLTSIKTANDSLWLNGVVFSVKGEGRININITRFVNDSNFNFSFESTELNDTVNFTIGEKQFQRVYLGSIVGVSIGTDTENSETSPFTDVFDDNGVFDMFYNIFPIMIIIFVVAMLFNFLRPHSYL